MNGVHLLVATELDGMKVLLVHLMILLWMVKPRLCVLSVDVVNRCINTIKEEKTSLSFKNSTTVINRIFSESCNPDFVDIDGDNCRKYIVNEWCSTFGGNGTGWDESYGTFEDFAVNGQTAAVCPQCGCGGGNLMYYYYEIKENITILNC